MSKTHNHFFFWQTHITENKQTQLFSRWNTRASLKKQLQSMMKNHWSSNQHSAPHCKKISEFFDVFIRVKLHNCQITRTLFPLVFRLVFKHFFLQNCILSDVRENVADEQNLPHRRHQMKNVNVNPKHLTFLISVWMPKQGTLPLKTSHTEKPYATLLSKFL